MGATSITQELTCPIAPAHMFKALIVGLNSLIPKLLPQFIKSVELVQGDGGAGSIEQVNIAEASHFKNVKHRIDELDKENFPIIEGDTLDDKIESIDYEIKFERLSVMKMTSKYTTKEALQVEEEEIRVGKEKAMT
ncbi:hypothetical protein EUGRSUZ_A00175 [Eucalyptus grandis]|uniref:Uncharacterized protein n=2 Tax=Eucalyptus grandis TaxID=71139 RepID=A0ACC3M1C4_EUCGR|nr:hypothetical protein EUGRSUZ_A00175 [Eucalyptus grandis]